jgi:MFS family permease
VTFRSVLAFQNFLLLMGVIFGLQFVDRSFGPVLPLYIAASGVSPSRVALVSGVLFSLAAGAGAAANYFCERLLRWISVRAIILSGAAVAAVASLVFAAVPVVPALLVAATVFGAGIGVATTAAYTAAGSVIPDAVRGTGFGLLTSAWLAGMALSPIVNGVLGATSIRAVFVLDVAGLALLVVVVARAMVEQRSQLPPGTLA